MRLSGKRLLILVAVRRQSGPLVPFADRYCLTITVAVPSFTYSLNSFLFLIPLSGLLASVLILLQVDPDPSYNLEPTSMVQTQSLWTTFPGSMVIPSRRLCRSQIS